VQTFKSKDRFRGFEVFLLKREGGRLRKRYKKPEERGGGGLGDGGETPRETSGDQGDSLAENSSRL
jgi:hypothetical protein